MRVQNDNERIVDTNYWGSNIESKGFFYLSPNAGAFRLLVPENQSASIADILTGGKAVITYGFHRTQFRFMYEIMFDDDSECPFAIWISSNQVEREFAIEEAAIKDRPLIVYRKGCIEVARMPVYFRTSPVLPYLKRWKSSGIEQLKEG